MTDKATSDLWWKSAVIYCVDVELFADSNDDGIGDFPGLTSRVEYLSGLGVTCIWLMPFFPSPNRDNGYDIADYYGVDPRLGSLGDVVEFLRAARERGIRVIADLVVNHTSVDHPWFRAARADRSSPYRDFYCWVDEPPADGPKEIVFPGQETSNWEFDESAGQYYLHRFYKSMPDLNITNPRVRDEIHKVVGFWLELGVSGFRLDAAPFIIEDAGIEHPGIADPHEYLRDLRAFLDRRRGDAILLAEANVPSADLRRFFGDEDGDEMHMLFNFVVNQRLFLSVVRQQAAPLADALRELPPAPEVNQWANFVKNHDELTLDKLSEAERDEVFAALAPSPEMRIYGRGIRRRVPPMLNGDRRRLQLVYSLLFALPGTPILLYGEEIGMGDDPSVEGRGSVRVAMQWDDRAGGFSVARPKVPVVEDGDFGYRRVNVADQRHDPHSLLNWTERLIRRRKELPELGWGSCRVLPDGDPAVLALRCDWRDSAVVTLHNFADRPARACPELEGDERGKPFELFADQRYDRIEALADGVPLGGYGFRWFRLR
ncbi:MAG TPA: alpha-amylase family protein [Actinomycetota bacterium]|jgi:maltose alpha-D-glucosyltransferase/alpha-amylase|nr:alpha-amylase family protein [Actinomycetota bacterium]